MKQYNMITTKFVDYLFDLYEGKISEIIKPMILRKDGDTIFLEGKTGIRTAVNLYTAPYDANMPCLGFALFGLFWPHVVPECDKLITRRIKELNKKV